MNNKEKSRNSMVDILKGLGMLIIIWTHYSWTAEERLAYLFPFWVDPAVPVFIIISGYVYSMSYRNKNMISLSDCYNHRFVIDKIIRYTVPFLLAYFVEIVYWIVIKQDISIPGIIVGAIDGGSGPGSYYYPIMIQFIFTFPLVYFIVKKFDFVGVIICFLINGGYEIIQRSYGVSEGNYRLFLFRYIFLMAFGCYLYIGKSKPKKWVAIISMVIGVGWLVVYQYLKYQPKVIIYWSGTCLLAALWIVPIAWLLLKSTRLNKVKCKPLEICGKASYNIFLTQMVFYISGVGAVYKYVENRAVQLILCLSINVVVGLVFYWIENKITTFIIHKVREKNYFEEKINNISSFLQDRLTQR